MSFNVTWNSVEDRLAGVYVSNRPAIPSPMPRAEAYTLPGRDGELFIYEATHDIIISVEFGWQAPNVGVDYLAAFRRFKDWIYSNGDGRLIFSDDPSVFYKCKFLQIVNHERRSKRVGAATVEFTCEPYTYLDSGRTPVNVSELVEDTLVSSYNVKSHPTYQIAGTGACTLTVNGKTFAVNVTDTALINTDRMTIQGTNLSWVNDSAIGNYEDLYLVPGDNVITITNGFTCAITPNWRCL